MIKVTFPDKGIKEFEHGVTPLEIAKTISNSLHKKILAVQWNNQTIHAFDELREDGNIQFLTWDDNDGKKTLWHSSAHIMAQALTQYFPNIKFGIGPPIDKGFYYDVDLGDKTLDEETIKKVEKTFLELCAQELTFIKTRVSKKDAIRFFQKKQDEYKLELINELEDGSITFYKQGTFTDLCKGPHISNSAFIKAFKILSLAGAYWRGDEKRKMLTRIYAISFPKQKLLDEYLLRVEEAQKRDHRKIGKELELFTFSENVGLGLPLWLPKGAFVREKLQHFMYQKQIDNGYLQVISPHIGNKKLYVISGHYEKYGEDSFQSIKTPIKDEEFLLKPMNCPHHCEMYKSAQHSYKNLPIRYAEFGTVYRYEQHGELHGLTRVRGFTQDDAHIFCTNEQLEDEFCNVIDLVLEVFCKLGFNKFKAQVSLRDKNDKGKYIGTEQNWALAEQAILHSVEKKKLDIKIEYGEAAFYGPKLDFMIQDALQREWQLGTIQVDYNLPERFKLEYIDSNNNKQRPVMIHRAPFGSLERFIAILLENTAGDLPLWLAPVQAKILPISEVFFDYAKEVVNTLKQVNIRADVDDRNEKIGRKIRETELMKIPFMLIVGEKEKQANAVSIRQRKKGQLGVFSIQETIDIIKKEEKV